MGQIPMWGALEYVFYISLVHLEGVTTEISWCWEKQFGVFDRNVTSFIEVIITYKLVSVHANLISATSIFESICSAAWTELNWKQISRYQQAIWTHRYIQTFGFGVFELVDQRVAFLAIRCRRHTRFWPETVLPFW